MEKATLTHFCQLVEFYAHVTFHYSSGLEVGNILIIRKSSSNSVSCMSGILRIIIPLHFYALIDDVSFVINWAKSSQIHNFVAIKGQLSKNGSSQTKEK